MSSESEQKPVEQPAASAEANATPAETSATPAPEYAPGSVEARLLTLDAKSSKKALHDSRTLKRQIGRAHV